MDHFFASGNKLWSITAPNDLLTVYTLKNSYTWLCTDTRDLLCRSREISPVHYLSTGRGSPKRLNQLLLYWCPGPNSGIFWDAHWHKSYWIGPRLLEVPFSRKRKNIAWFSSLPWQHPPSNVVRHTPPWDRLEYKTVSLKAYFTVLQKPINCTVLPLFPEKCIWDHIFWLWSIQIFHSDTFEMSCFNHVFLPRLFPFILISLLGYI